MEYTQSIAVHVPRERFIELFDDPENLSQWMDGLLSFEPQTGAPGEHGATSRMTFRHGRGTMDMVETILRRQMPDHFDATYDAKGVHNVCRNQFIDVDGTSTEWVAHNIFEMRGYMKIIARVFGASFRKESYKTMEAFKTFAEANA